MVKAIDIAVPKIMKKVASPILCTAQTYFLLNVLFLKNPQKQI
jgi:hypothetical protein